jgi:glutamyl-tRNA synthetase
MVKVRFAPSPSGSLHIGSARTAIVNYLFAKSLGGKFVLRIEDTDTARSTQESKDTILSTLAWLGITWDEGPFYQSERFSIYQKYLDELLLSGNAYRCFCSGEDILRKDKLARENLYTSYDGRCATLSEDEIKKKLREKTPYIIRLKMPTEKIVFNDLLKGNLAFQGDLLSDIIIARSDGSPTYNFAVVVDDYLMEISHVIRGEDHLSNTPKQIAIYRALGWESPQFCHIPLILGPDKTKLSKRHGDTAIEDYQNKGFLPEAIFCYLALLGYSRNPTKEIFDQKTLSEDFQLNQLSTSPSQFDITNLIWMNAQFIKSKDHESLWHQAQKWLEPILIEEEKKKKIFFLSINQIKKLDDIPGIYEPFLTYVLHQENPQIQKIIQSDELLPYAQEFFLSVDRLQDYSEKNIENLLEEVIAKDSINKRSFIQLIRLVLMGSLISPPLFDTFLLLGKTEVLRRYYLFISEIKNDKKN